MSTTTKDPVRRQVGRGLLHSLRSWCIALSIVFLALAVMSLRNTAANPETWASSFHALAASGAFVQYGVWLAAVGGLFLLMALVVSFALRRMRE